jgi:hypothetical protein
VWVEVGIGLDVAVPTGAEVAVSEGAIKGVDEGEGVGDAALVPPVCVANVGVTVGTGVRSSLAIVPNRSSTSASDKP